MTGSNTWVDSARTGACYKIWDGCVQSDTIELDGSTGHIEGLTLRLSITAAHVWRLYWANSQNAILNSCQGGNFNNGHGDFYAQDTINGKTLLIRYDWTKLTSSAPHFEQSFSDDGGKTWEAVLYLQSGNVRGRRHRLSALIKRPRARRVRRPRLVIEKPARGCYLKTAIFLKPPSMIRWN